MDGIQRPDRHRLDESGSVQYLAVDGDEMYSIKCFLPASELGLGNGGTPQRLQYFRARVRSRYAKATWPVTP